MLFSKKKSALVRLSDCIKLGIGNCLDTTNDLIALHVRYEEPLRKTRAIAKDTLEDRIPAKEGEKQILEVNKNIPEEDARRAVSLQGRLHSECLSVLLNCCFALESYVNSLGYHLLQEKDFLGLFHAGHEATAEVLIDAIEKMSTLTKWETIGKLKKGKGFDRSKSPFQDLKILFNFRNDIVHDKVADYSDDREDKRYNKKLPDPVFGFLTLRHVVFAADTYWGMISEIHTILGTDMKEFHRHYNLKPWFTTDFEQEVRKASASYVKVAEQTG
jgi:hypothetical protein